MAILKEIERTYEVSLDDMKKLIADSLNVEPYKVW